MLEFLGFDPAIVNRLERTHAASYTLFAWTAMGSVLLAVFAMGLLFHLAVGSWWVTPPAAVAAGLFWLNIQRLVHAGARYPVHMDLEGISVWRPAAGAAVVAVGLGLFLAQPVVAWSVGDGTGEENSQEIQVDPAQLVMVEKQDPGLAPMDPATLLGRLDRAWDQEARTFPLMLLFTLLFSGGMLLRLQRPEPVRAYEREVYALTRAQVVTAWFQAEAALDSAFMERGVLRRRPPASPFGEPALIAGRVWGTVLNADKARLEKLLGPPDGGSV